MVRFNEDQLPLNGESMAVSTSDMSPAELAYEKGKEAGIAICSARDAREERVWRALALIAAGVGAWGLFSIASALSTLSGVLAVK